MTDEKAMKQSKSVYETLCKTLEEQEFDFKRHDEDLTVTLGVRGDDLPMDIIFIVNPRSQVISLYSPLPYKISGDKLIDVALAICIANNGLINGSFDLDISDNTVSFRIVTSFRESILSGEVITYMLGAAFSTIDNYNDKILMISKGMLTIEKFIEMENDDQDN